MLLFLTIFMALQLASSANGFLDECPIDREQRIGDFLVVNILEEFYRDLMLVQAATESPQSREYLSIAREIDDISLRFEPESSSAEDVCEFFEQIMALLREDRFNEAEVLMEERKLEETFASGWPMTYYEYLQAEIYRLLGNHYDASTAVLAAFAERRDWEGVSLNDLERIDGLIALQKVSRFNQDIDKMFGLNKSPDYQLLSLIHMMTKSDVRPLNELRSTIIDRLFHRAPTVGSFEPGIGTSGAAMDEGMIRVKPHLDDFDARSVSKSSVQEILCEFAQKLSILGVSSREEESVPTDYSEVMDQLRGLDPDFATKLDSRVVNLFDTNLEQAKENAHAMWSDIWVSSPPRHEVQVAFACYFCIELYRQSKNRCDIWMINEMQGDSNAIRHMRKKRGGVSMDKIAELEARVVLVWLECFHLRVQSVYNLDGTEDEQELETKRALLRANEKFSSELILDS